MNIITFCPIPTNAKADDKCLDPGCNLPMSLHYRFNKPEIIQDDKIYNQAKIIWEITRKTRKEENQKLNRKFKEKLLSGPNQKLWECLIKNDSIAKP